jgi:C_GCAxxG_C_C family probable redox protein
MGKSQGGKEMKREDIVKKALDTYLKGGFHCAEVISKTITDIFGTTQAVEIPKVASGFGGGMGLTKQDTCGTLNGGIIALGYLFGRDTPGADMKTVAALTSAFRERFLEINGSTRCPEILEKFGEQENMVKCKKMTAAVTGMLAELIREMQGQGPNGDGHG